MPEREEQLCLSLVHPLTPSSLAAFSPPPAYSDTSSSCNSSSGGIGVRETRIPVKVTGLAADNTGTHSPGGTLGKHTSAVKKKQGMMMEQICMLEKKHWVKSQSWGDQCMRMMSKPNMHVIAVHLGDGTVVGYCIVSCQSLCGTISKVFVKKEYRRLRLGTFMLSITVEYIARLKGVGYRVMLYVEHQNSHAQGLYAKLGFEKENLLKDYYNVGSHAYRMIKSP